MSDPSQLDDRLDAAETVLAFVTVAVLWSVVEVTLRGGIGLVVLMTAFGAGAALGLLHGLLWVGLLRGPSRARAPWPMVIHAAAAIATGLWLAMSLGAWAKLGTRNHDLALGALSACAALSLLVFATCRLVAPSGVTSPQHRRAVAIALVAGAVIATWIDRTMFVALHPPAHACLRAATVAGVALAWTVLGPHRVRHGRETIAVLVTLACAGIPFLTLRDAADPALASLWATPITDQSIATLRGLTDVDGDGASGVLGGGDCEPLDPEVYPGAIEIAGNGIDDNCLAGDAAAATIDLAATPVPEGESPRSVLLVTVETLRADHMGLYGYARDTTPQLQHWALRARVYERAFTAGAWTSIAISTLLRGVNARRVPWQPWAETDKGRLIRAGETATLDADEHGVQTFMLPEGGVPTIGWWLQRRGMATLAVVDDRFSELLDPTVGTDAGFDTFVDADAIAGRDPDDRVVDLALETLASVPKGRKFFMWVHLFGPHSPNTGHVGVPSFGTTLADGYDHEIRFVDEQIGRLLQGVTERDPQLVWIVTADHGETLLERDRMHGFDLSEPVMRVPLIVGSPELSPGRTSEVVSTLDIAPTILASTRTLAPAYFDGFDLHGTTPVDRLVLFDTWHRRFDGTLLFDQIGVTDGTIEMVYDLTKNAWGLVDLRAPPDQPRPPDEIAKVHDAVPMRAAILDYLDAPALQPTE